jgi:hypothetical protein
MTASGSFYVAIHVENSFWEEDDSQENTRRRRISTAISARKPDRSNRAEPKIAEGWTTNRSDTPADQTVFMILVASVESWLDH